MHLSCISRELSSQQSEDSSVFAVFAAVEFAVVLAHVFTTLWELLAVRRFRAQWDYPKAELYHKRLSEASRSRALQSSLLPLASTV